jgi:adenylate cyclase
MSKSGKIITAQSTYDFVKSEFVCEYRGEIYAKNRGNLNMYFGNGVKTINPKIASVII